MEREFIMFMREVTSEKLWSCLRNEFRKKKKKLKAWRLLHRSKKRLIIRYCGDCPLKLLPHNGKSLFSKLIYHTFFSQISFWYIFQISERLWTRSQLSLWFFQKASNYPWIRNGLLSTLCFSIHNTLCYFLKST